MRVGDKIYVIGHFGQVEEAIVKGKSEGKYWKIQHKIGSNIMPEELLYETYEEALDAIGEKLECELENLKENMHTREELMQTLYGYYIWEEPNELIHEYVKNQIKIHTGVDVYKKY